MRMVVVLVFCFFSALWAENSTISLDEKLAKRQFFIGQIAARIRTLPRESKMQMLQMRERKMPRENRECKERMREMKRREDFRPKFPEKKL